MLSPITHDLLHADCLIGYTGPQESREEIDHNKKNKDSNYSKRIIQKTIRWATIYVCVHTHIHIFLSFSCTLNAIIDIIIYTKILFQIKYSLVSVTNWSITPVNCGEYYVGIQHRKMNKTRNTIVLPEARDVSALLKPALKFC